MDTFASGAQTQAKLDDERSRQSKRIALKRLNANPMILETAKLDSSLKRHTAFIKRIRQSLALDNKDQIVKDIESLSLEKYVDELSGAVLEGLGRCKAERDVWGAVEVISLLHRRFPSTFTPALVASLAAALAPPSKVTLAALTPEQKEKEDISRVSRQRPILRVCSELALVGVIKDSPGRSGGEWIMKTIKELLSNDPSLSSLPLLTTFLKSYSRSYLGLKPPPVSDSNESTENVSTDCVNGITWSDYEELIEQDIRDRFKRMSEGYFDNVCKKLVIEHKRLQEQDKRNHEAYIRSGEIFEDRQQTYERMTKGYERLLANCQSLSELLFLPLPSLPTTSQKSDSILIGSNNSNLNPNEEEEGNASASKWEDDEERKFFEDIQDLKDYVPSSVLGLEGADSESLQDRDQDREKEREREEIRKLAEELEKLGTRSTTEDSHLAEEAEADISTPTPGSPKATSPPLSPQLAPQGPSQLLGALLTRLPDATNRVLIDQAAIDFAFLNSKAARRRLVKFLAQVPKNRIDLLPHYSRLVATLSRYMSDLGVELVAMLDEEFRYLQRKKNVVKELAETRLKNITYLTNLTKFRVVPSHLILHMFKVCLDDFTGVNIENLALLLEGCGRFLLRSEETSERFAAMLELMKRKQNLRHLDHRQVLLLENAYYQCNPPERAPRKEKERTPIELFIRHLVYDVLSKKTIDKVLKLVRKLDWDDQLVQITLHKIFTKPWKIKYGNISLLAMLTYDLQRYRPAFAIAVVDQVLEDIRRGLEQNVYSTNQIRVASIKYLGELYIYRLLSSGIIFDTLWTLMTFGHVDGRPLPKGLMSLDMPDDYFRIRLVCVLLDTCGMCFDRGTQKRKLDNFLIFFQYYIYCKNQPLPMDIDFMLSDSLEAIRPKHALVKSLEEAAAGVDDMLASTFQSAGNDDSGEDSGEEDGPRDQDDDDEEEDVDGQLSPVEERAPSPEPDVVLSASNSNQEHLGPTEEAEAEFAKELAKLVTDTSAESKRLDRKSTLAIWDLPPSLRKKSRYEEEAEAEVLTPVMNFTVITKKGNKQQAKQLAIPAESALAIHTRSAQLQDKVEQQQLKRLVLDYEMREEAEELKALEVRNRSGAIKIRYVG